MYKKYIKRVLDVVVSSCGLVVLGIPMLIVAVIIRFDLGSPVLFTQERIGKDEKPFTLYKFRSMRNAVDENGVPLPDNKRVTKFGMFIRKTSIDELPSLINILKGEMSVIGPRPLPTTYKEWFYEEERVRHTVRGGLTGLAQINGRNTSSWEERFKYDTEYVKDISWKNDFIIFLRTIGKVLGQTDIGERGKDAPMDFHVYRSGLTEKELIQRTAKEEDS